MLGKADGGRKDAPSLTPRERDVLRGIVSGKTNAAIGHDLGIGYDTVKMYVARLQAKLGAPNRVAIAVYAVQNELALALGGALALCRGLGLLGPCLTPEVSMLTLLRNENDWLAYRAQKTREFKLEGSLVDWGGGPAEYPCLVCSYPASPSRVVSAYFFEANARELLDAVKEAGSAGAPAAAGPSFAEQQDDFNKWVTAHLLAVVHYLVETGICTRDKFEQRLNEALSLVDEVSAAQRDARLAGFTPAARDVVERLRGRPREE